MILLKNTQLAVKVSNRKVIQQVQLLLTAAGYRDWDIGVCLTGNTKVKQLNSRYRGKDRATDILSFPFAEAIKPGKLPTPMSEDDKNLGDIFISMKYVNNWCESNKVDIHERLPVLYAHGICHLLGYDHSEDHDYAVMKRKEIRILKKMKNWESLLEEDETKGSSKKP